MKHNIAVNGHLSNGDNKPSRNNTTTKNDITKEQSQPSKLPIQSDRKSDINSGRNENSSRQQENNHKAGKRESNFEKYDINMNENAFGIDVGGGIILLLLNIKYFYI